MPLVVADIMRGTGRYNLALGAIATMVGIGASLSGLAAGEIVDHFGYSMAFLALGAAATVALIVLPLACPKPPNRRPYRRSLESAYGTKRTAAGLTKLDRSRPIKVSAGSISMASVALPLSIELSAGGRQ